MVCRLNKIPSELDDIVEWVLTLTGTVFAVSTTAQAIGWAKTGNVVRDVIFVEINLDTLDRISLNLWNHLFV